VNSQRARVSLRGRTPCRLVLVVMSLGLAGAEAFAQEECLVTVKGPAGVVAEGGTVCGEATNKACVFQLQLCLNEGDSGCVAAPMKKKVKAKGRCGSVGKLQVKPDGSNATCGSTVGIKVKTKKKGTREGKCTLKVVVKSTDKPARKDVDKVQLVCKPTPGECPTTLPTTTVTTTTATTTTLPSCIQACDCCVVPISQLAGCVSR
jgi:hypothetical protein